MRTLLTAIVLAFFGLVTTADFSLAQDTEREGRVKVKFPTLPDEAPPGQELTIGLQEALVDSVADDLQKIVVLCANACEPAESSDSSAIVSSRVQEGVSNTYVCTEKKCVCIGGNNCVQMIVKEQQCRKRTVKCTGAGCTCKKQSKKRAR